MNNTEFAPGIAGGKHLSGAPLTTDIAHEGSPDLMRNAIDKAVTKIRPMATPLDQISRLGHVRDVDSMEVDYYSVDTRKERSKIVSIRENAAEDSGQRTFIINVEDPKLFEPSETLVVMQNGTACFTGYVSERTPEGLLVATFDNAALPDGKGLECIRMGRAATQLDVQSPQFSVLPTKNTNFCQIFK